MRIEGTRIAEVGPARSMEGTPVVDFGEAVILPGLVNAHTHLELGFFAGQAPPGKSFVDWIERLAATKAACPDFARTAAASVRTGMKQSLAAGVTTVGDVTTRPQSVRSDLKHGPLRVVSFGEVIAIGSRRNLLAERLQAAIDGAHASDYLTVAVSPHAPYSIEPDGIRACVEAAERLNMRLCMHLAETVDEARFTERGDGPLGDLLRHFGVADNLIPCPQMTPVALAHQCGALSGRTVLAHCNYVSNEDLALLAASGAHVAYCPRTHAAFGHDPHPFRRMLGDGINVCIGTDSLASNPSLSVLEEIRHLHEVYPDLNGSVLIEMATIRGARALGLFEAVGTLARGKYADVTVLPLEPDGAADAVENVLSSSLKPLVTYVRGKRV